MKKLLVYNYVDKSKLLSFLDLEQNKLDGKEDAKLIDLICSFKSQIKKIHTKIVNGQEIVIKEDIMHIMMPAVDIIATIKEKNIAVDNASLKICLFVKNMKEFIDKEIEHTSIYNYEQSPSSKKEEIGEYIAIFGVFGLALSYLFLPLSVYWYIPVSFAVIGIIGVIIMNHAPSDKRIKAKYNSSIKKIKNINSRYRKYRLIPAEPILKYLDKVEKECLESSNPSKEIILDHIDDYKKLANDALSSRPHKLLLNYEIDNLSAHIINDIKFKPYKNILIESKAKLYTPEDIYEFYLFVQLLKNIYKGNKWKIKKVYDKKICNKYISIGKLKELLSKLSSIYSKNNSDYNIAVLNEIDIFERCINGFQKKNSISDESFLISLVYINGYFNYRNESNWLSNRASYSERSDIYRIIKTLSIDNSTKINKKKLFKYEITVNKNDYGYTKFYRYDTDDVIIFLKWFFIILSIIFLIISTVMAIAFPFRTDGMMVFPILTIVSILLAVYFEILIEGGWVD